MSVTRTMIGEIELLRVGYADVEIPPERVGLSEAQVRGVGWAEPLWAGDGQLRAGAAVWVIRAGDAVIAVDPAMAADEILRSDADAGAHQEAFASVMADAGVARQSVTHAIATHVEGIGMFAWLDGDGSWSPFFPNANIHVGRSEIDAVDAGTHPSPPHPAFSELREHGAVSIIDDDATIAQGVRVALAAGHTPGHLIVHVESLSASAAMIGHLAVSALHLATGECPQQHPDPATAEAAVVALRASGSLLVGPLWPTPGAGYWREDALVALDG